MRVMYARCCGLDVHKKLIVACLLVVNAQGELDKQIRSFSCADRPHRLIINSIIENTINNYYAVFAASLSGSKHSEQVEKPLASFSK